MRELKRVLLFKRILGLLALLLAVNLMLLFAQDTQQDGFYAVYRQELSQVQGVDFAQAQQRISLQRSACENTVTLGVWQAETDAYFKQLLYDRCVEAYGEGFEQLLAEGKLSADAESASLRLEALQKLDAQLTYLQQYPQYLDTVHANAKQMAALSIFNQDGGFSAKNIEKTNQDFPIEVALSLDNDFAIEFLASDTLGGYSLLVFAAALVLSLVQESLTLKDGRWLVNPAPTMALMNRNVGSYQRQNGLVLLLTLALLLSGSFAVERQCGMKPLLQGSPRGRRQLWLCKIGAAYVLTALVFFLFQLRELALIRQTYGAFGTAAPIQSLAYFSDVTVSITVGGGIAIYIALRLLTALAVASCVCCLSSLCRRINTAVLISAGVLLLPACLSYMGITVFDRLSFGTAFSPLEYTCRSYFVIVGILFAALFVTCVQMRGTDDQLRKNRRDILCSVR